MATTSDVPDRMVGTLTSLSKSPRAHFFIVRLGELQFVCDCGVDLLHSKNHPVSDSSAKSTAPSSAPLETNPWTSIRAIDWANVDFIVISNHFHLAALPFITEYTDFSGQIYFTEAGLVFGRCVLEEELRYQETVRVVLEPSASTAVQRSGEVEDLGSRSNRASLPYLLSDVFKCLEKIQDVRYRETRYPLPGVQVTAHSSGYALGSANWLVEYEGYRLCLVSNASLSVCSFHPSELDWKPVESCDMLAMMGSYTNDRRSPLPLSQTLNQITSLVVSTLKQHGNVLFPCYLMGPIFDLLEMLHMTLESTGQLRHVRMYAISPTTDRSLLYSNIMGEWMCPAKQGLLYLPEAPLVHDELITAGKLRYFTSLDQLTRGVYKEPCIFFAGHPSLRMGPARELLRIVGNSDRHCVILTDPSSDVYGAWDNLVQHQQVSHSAPQCQIRTIPIDVDLSVQDLQQVVQRTTATNILVSDVTRTCFETTLAESLRVYHPGEPLPWVCGRPRTRMAHLSEKLAQEAAVHQLQGRSIARIQGCVRMERDGLWIQPAQGVTMSHPKRRIYGQLLTDRLLSTLEQVCIV
ncbi:Integrator complex subunit 9 [Dispira simplex]|nr:Integrator complex subunit 9 [Dispira simplex]